MDEKRPDTEHVGDISQILGSRDSIRNYENRSLKAALPQIFAAVSAASYHILAGMCLSYPAILIPQLFDGNSTTSEINIDKEGASWLASVVTVATIPSAWFGGFVIDVIGRLHSIRLALLPTLIGWILIATAFNMPMLIIGRILTGIPIPWGTGSGVAYITEISSPHLRGSLMSLNSFCISLSFLLIYAVGSVLHWRVVAWICTGATILPFLLLMFIPESPSWLMMKGRYDQALKSLEWFNKYQDEALTKIQYSSEQKRALLNTQKKAKSTDLGFAQKAKLFLDPTCYKPLLILFGLFFFQQFTGIYMTLVYAVNFMKDIGGNINPYVGSIYLGAGRFGTALINLWLYRYFKRRNLLFACTIGMSVTMTISAMFTNWLHQGATTYTWVPVLMPVLYVVFAVIGLQTLPFMYGSELFPLEVRGIAQSVSLSFVYFLIFIATKSYFTLEDFLGGIVGLQYYFAAMSVGALVFCYIFVPETHNKKLFEIEDYFRNHTAYLSVKKNARASEDCAKHIKEDSTRTV